MITVLMAINKYDGYCPKAIESILNQSIQEIELLIIANGPDATHIKQLILDFCRDDSRVNILVSPIGQLSHALNIGIDHALYDVIARMDADDISHPLRLEKQLNYLRKYDLDMVGCNAQLINEDDAQISTRIMPRGKKICSRLPFTNTFIHPSIIIKKSILLNARGYNSGFNSEDYDLWLRLRRMGIKWDNIDESLLQYRIHSSASQRRILGYAESLGYAAREFILNKSFVNFFAFFYHFFKSIFRAKK